MRVYSTQSLWQEARKKSRGRIYPWICLLLHPRDSLNIFAAKVLNFFALHVIIAGGLCDLKTFKRNRNREAKWCDVSFSALQNSHICLTRQSSKI
jgi:hypothetical protein